MIYSKNIIKNSKAVFVLVYGMGATASRWDDFVKYLNKQKISSYILELQGYGKTKGPRGFVPRFSVYLDDLKKMYLKAKKENRGKKIFLVGESMGGLIALRYCLDNPEDFDGLVPIVPALGNKMPIPNLRILFFNVFRPTWLVDMPFNSKMITHDKKMQKKINDNPQEITVASARLNILLLKSLIKIHLSAKKLKTPTFILASGKDLLVSTKATEMFFRKLKCPKKLNVYKNMLHALTVETGREKIFRDISAWTNLINN